METKKQTGKKTTLAETTETNATNSGKTRKATPGKRISKTWKAAMKSQGSIEILDMEALFKPVSY